ncbi:hypothetical protein Taro_031447 [Colocasia esculenta]|uniref:Uncharacterized protein n=1 Tax=Colocasia esculenta TaxID=4460 RepID=A0A843VQ18_COLES|nr:hypothetical protein [Colocasia esculenta]
MLSSRWLAEARGKTLVRKTGSDWAENSGSGCDFCEEASKGSAQIEVWQDFFHASERQSMLSSTLPLTSSYVAVYFLVSDSRCCRLPTGEFPASCAFPSSVV